MEAGVIDGMCAELGAESVIAAAAARLEVALACLIMAADLMERIEAEDGAAHEANIDLAIDMCRVTRDSIVKRIIAKG